MRQSTRCALALVPALSLGLHARPACAQISFTDVTATAGINHSSETYGASWGDLNGDGLPDLYVSNHRTMDSLWLNQGNGRFVDVAGQVARFLGHPRVDTHGGTWADFDNDGDQDLLISTGGGPSELLVNENAQLAERTEQLGIAVVNQDARMPIWLDYDRDHRLDVALTQFGGAVRLFHQLSGGGFTDVTAAAKLDCARVEYGQLFDADGDGHLDFICPGASRFPQSIYDTTTMPWKTLTSAANPAAFLPLTANVADSAVADFNDDGHMDLFLLTGAQLHLSGVVQSGSNRFEASLAGGPKGFQFSTTGAVTMTVDWNAAVKGGSTDLAKIQIGHAGRHPAGTTFILDPADPSSAGMPPAPKDARALPALQIGYDAPTHRWTVNVVTSLGQGQGGGFSLAYFQVVSRAAITGLAATGLWPTDHAAPPTLLMNRDGAFIDTTVAAGLDAPVQCSSVTAGDFDNDMYVDLYLACRTAASNVPNILYHNNHDGTFSAVSLAGGAAGPVGLAVASDAGTADSVVTADYDMDGFLDLFVTNGFNMQPLYRGGPDKLYHNNGNGNHWIELDLVGTNSDRDATGAQVWASATGVTQFRVQDGRYHRWSQDARRIHFGLAGASAVNLTVKWPSGATQTFANVAANRVYQIAEDSPKPVALGSVPAALDVAPAAPAGLTATPGDGSVQLAWNAVSGATSYSVYQGTVSGAEGPTPVKTAVTGTVASIAPLTNGTTYYFVVDAHNATLASGPSNEVSATPAAPASAGAGSSTGSGSNSGGGGSGRGGSGGGGAVDLWMLLASAMALFLRHRSKATHG
ncbi:MAG TPA: FG-GAP-like repeat-containing protein [Mycobacterium sp.]|nr:FG-GAP-like repeat-containing protein [Mycobacterium sp.]